MNLNKKQLRKLILKEIRRMEESNDVPAMIARGDIEGVQRLIDTQGYGANVRRAKEEQAHFESLSRPEQVAKKIIKQIQVRIGPPGAMIDQYSYNSIEKAIIEILSQEL